MKKSKRWFNHRILREKNKDRVCLFNGFLINLLRDLPLTILVSTHDLRMVKELFPRMVIMDEGRIVADGETGVLLEDEGLLERHGLEGV